MKEFTSQTGGRYTYTDDILNLQDLALSIASIFDGCENFIISGCNVSGNTISPGFVYINGKIRKCTGTSSASTWPMYIYEQNKAESVPYVDSGDKVGRNLYGCAISQTVPDITDTLTKQKPQFIAIDKGGAAVRMAEAFFGKYAILNNPVASSQVLNKDIEINGRVDIKKLLQLFEGLTSVKGNSTGDFKIDPAGNLVITLNVSSKGKFSMIVTTTGNFEFYKDDTKLATISADGTRFSTPVNLGVLKSGGLTFTGDHIFNHTAQDEGTLNINMRSSNSETTFFRNTVIGDGKGVAILTVKGKDHSVNVDGTILSVSDQAAITFKSKSHSKSDMSLQNFMSWIDRDGAVLGRIGYDSKENTRLDIYNAIGDVAIGNTLLVGGRLYIGDKDISQIYVDQQTYKMDMGKKADAVKVYDKMFIDGNTAFLSKGLTQFVSACKQPTSEAQEILRQQIGACGAKEIAGCVSVSKNFSDIVNQGLPRHDSLGYEEALKERKKTLCKAIGAAYEPNTHMKPRDTGWIRITNHGGTSERGLWVKQIGHIVCIEGDLKPPHSGIVFTLPDTIDPPHGAISYGHTHQKGWQCYMEGGSRTCSVTKCDGGCHSKIGFLLTYMV